MNNSDEFSSRSPSREYPRARVGNTIADHSLSFLADKDTNAAIQPIRGVPLSDPLGDNTRTKSRAMPS